MSKIYKPRLFVVVLIISIILLPYKFYIDNEKFYSIIGFCYILITITVLLSAFLFYKKYASYEIEINGDKLLLNKNFRYSLDECYLDYSWLICGENYIFLKVYHPKLTNILKEKITFTTPTFKEELSLIKKLGFLHPIWFVSLFLIGTSCVSYILQ